MNNIDELLTRGVDKIYPTREELEEVLISGKKLKVYQGFDPTGDKLHIGHMIGLRKLRDWQRAGHEVIFLIGDFTGMVGDPSGKTTARKMLSKEEVAKNAKSYIDQAGRILSFDGENPVKILYNSEWLAKLSAIEFIRISGLLSVQQVVERDLFQERQKQNQDIYMNEFLYPVMQAYDSVAMDVDIEIGGTDQMFNMLMGRKLMRHMLKKDKFVITTPLLTDSEGKKIGKTEGNIIGLTDEPAELYGKIMSLGDDVIVKGLQLLTDISTEEIKNISEKIMQGINPIEFKKRLAFEIVKQLNNEEDADKAQSSFQSTVQNKELPTNLPTYAYSSMASLSTVAMENMGTASVSEWKRLVEQGGVVWGEDKISDPNVKVSELSEEGKVLKVGKRNVVKIKNP